MDFSQSPEDVLIAKVQKLVEQERTLAHEILHYLREIDARKAYAITDSSSLFAFCVEKLKYSGNEANTRIAAARVLHELPEVDQKLAEGAHSITNLSLARSYFNQVDLTREQKLDVMSAIENLSTRLTKKFFLNLLSEPLREDSKRQVTPDHVEVRFVMTEEQDRKLEHVRDLKSHSHPGIKMGELVELMADFCIEAWNPVRRAERAIQRSAHGTISVDVTHLVWLRDGYQCAVVDPHTGARCTCTTRLEIDHIVPRAKGGKDELRNMRVACREHNQRLGFEEFGEKVSRHWRQNRSGSDSPPSVPSES